MPSSRSARQGDKLLIEDQELFQIELAAFGRRVGQAQLSQGAAGLYRIEQQAALGKALA
jgi:hypothetical protein